MGCALALDLDALFCELHALYVICACVRVCFVMGFPRLRYRCATFFVCGSSVICACARVFDVMGFDDLQFSVQFRDDVRGVRDLCLCSCVKS